MAPKWPSLSLVPFKGPKRGKRIDPADCNLIFNNNEIGKPENVNLLYPIDRVHYDGEETTFKLLGVLFDENLSFDDHVSNLCGKISKSLYCMNRVKNFITHAALKMLYFSMVHSHLSYCRNIYGSANATSRNSLKIKQKAAIRIVCNAGHRDHTHPLFKRLGILPLNELIKYSNLKFMHNFWHRKLPLSFHDMWTASRDHNPNLVLRNANNLYITAHNYAMLKRLPLFSFPKIWNDDTNLKENPSLRAYMKSVKSFFLNSIVL